MLVKTLLNKVERFKSFVYGSVCVMLVGGAETLVIDIEPRRNSRPICPVGWIGNRLFLYRGVDVNPFHMVFGQAIFPFGCFQCFLSSCSMFFGPIRLRQRVIGI